MAPAMIAAAVGDGLRRADLCVPVRLAVGERDGLDLAETVVVPLLERPVERGDGVEATRQKNESSQGFLAFLHA